jgi:hypothetical protein
MKIEELAFPIMVFVEGEAMIYALPKSNEIKRTSEEVLKQGRFFKMLIIDSSGISYRVKEVIKISYRGLWGYHPLFKGRLITVDIEVSPTGENYGFGSLKEKVLEILKNTRNPFLIEEWGGRKAAVNRVNSTDNMASLISLFC